VDVLAARPRLKRLTHAIWLAAVRSLRWNSCEQNEANV